jgi:hypothetical protein
MNRPGASVHGAAASARRGLEPAFAGTTARFGTARGRTVSGRAVEPPFPAGVPTASLGTADGVTASGRAVEPLFSADLATAEFVPGWSGRP